MYNVVLKFADNRAAAPEHMDAHRAWISDGFDRGIFLAVGTLAEKQGGGIWAYNCSPAELEALVKEDPFVVHGVVTAEITQMTPARVDARLAFLKEG